MEKPWKIRGMSYLLFASIACLLTQTCSTSVPQTLEETKSAAKNDDQKDVDLDLETQDQIAILKQINRVNEDGSYTFGYEAADGSFKIETRDVNGNVKGMFGFINENGELKRVSYSASNGTGFQASGAFNVPSLPGINLSSEEESEGVYGNVPRKLFQQGLFSVKDETSTRIDLLPPSTNIYDERTTELIPTPRLPIYIFSTTPAENDVTTTARPVVIQHIPKGRTTPATSTTETVESEVARKTAYGRYSPKKTSNANYVTFKSSDITTETTENEEATLKPSVIQVIKPRTGPYKKVIVTKRPLIETTTPKTVTTTEYTSKEYLQTLNEKSQGPDSGFRGSIDFDNGYATTSESTNLVTSGTEDSPDVYGGSPTPRPYTTVAYRTLFTQIPQHQRILHNSYIQNQNQYLAAAFPPNLPSEVNPQLAAQMPPSHPARVLPATPVIADNIGAQPNIYNRPDPRGSYPVPSQPLNRIFPNPIPVQPAYANSMQLQPPPYAPQPYNPQLYIPPGLLETLIRMLLSVQERQLAYQQSVLPPLNARNLPPELIENRYGPYPQSAFLNPNYSQGTQPYPLHFIPRLNYDPRLIDPRTYLNPYSSLPLYSDPRLNYHAVQSYRPPLYGPYQGRSYQTNQDPLLSKMFLGVRPSLFTPQVQSSQNTVERSVTYDPKVPDSTTSSTTSKPRIGAVRNVQILNPNEEESEESQKFERDIKS